MRNKEVAAVLYEFADVLELLNIEWKPIAYRKAARTIESMHNEVEDIYKEKGEDGLDEIPNVGKGIARDLKELIKNGKISELERLRKKMPKEFSKLISIQGMGPKKAWKLYKRLGIDTVSKLKKAAEIGKISKLEGFGVQSERDILAGIEMFEKGHERQLLGAVLPIANSIAEELRKVNGVKRADVAGSLRRMKETVKDIDILVISSKPKDVIEKFVSMKDVKRVLAKGETKSAIVLNVGLNVDLRVVPEKSYGAALNYFTGSKEHNVHLRQLALRKGWTLSEYGLFNLKDKKYIAGRSEQELFKKLGMMYIEPEMRENSGEVEASLKNRLPKLICYDDLQGDLHIHSKWSDGSDSISEMIDACAKKGYIYMAFTDHSKSEKVANGLDEKRLVKYFHEIEKASNGRKIQVLKGAEVDILKNGKLDYGNKTLEKLDFIIGSVHSGFKSSRQEMTKKIVTAISSGRLHVFGHPTGRLINRREGYDFDMDKVFQAAKDSNVALEINSQPNRLDLRDVHIRKALEYGCKFIINTDSHSVDQLENINLGIGMARRGWLESKHVVNTLPLKSFERWVYSI